MALHLSVIHDEPKDFIDHEGIVWRRTGYCCGCGACCVGDPEDSKAVMCSKFVPNADGIGGKCSVYGGSYWYYQSACKHWPGHPSAIKDKPECTYKFEAIK